MVEIGTVRVPVVVDATDAVAVLKQIERSARKAARAVAELREVWNAIDDAALRARLLERGIRLSFDPPHQETESEDTAESKEDRAHE